MSYAWARKGERKRVPHENPQGRRYNTMAILVPAGPDAAFDWCGSTRRHFTAADLIHLLTTRARTAVPLVVVLDNAGIHRARAIREALPRLRAHNVYLYYLPPYCPELNAIERTFRAVKHTDLPERRYTSAAALEEAVDAAYDRYETKLKRHNQSRLAA